MANQNIDLIPLYDWGMFTEPRPSVVAGPCSAETEEQVMETAKGLRELGINVYRAGIWKPRTHPGSFEGMGVQGLKWMQRAKKEYGLKISTEVASEKHVFECLKYGVDLVWLGARTTANPFLVQEIADALTEPLGEYLRTHRVKIPAHLDSVPEQKLTMPHEPPAMGFVFGAIRAGLHTRDLGSCPETVLIFD